MFVSFYTLIERRQNNTDRMGMVKLSSVTGSVQKSTGIIVPFLVILTCLQVLFCSPGTVGSYSCNFSALMGPCLDQLSYVVHQGCSEFPHMLSEILTFLGFVVTYLLFR